MIGRLRVVEVSLGTVAAVISLSACSSVDTFGSRAIRFNDQMDDARKAVVLKNILRAAADQPLQFTDVTTVSGVASIQGSIGSSLPVAGMRATGQQLFTLSPAGQISGGPTFTVSSLNTKEFFYGISTPLEDQVIQTYSTIGSSKQPLLLIFAERIEFDLGTETNHKHYVYTNSDPTDPERNLFVSVLENLLRAHLTVEKDPASETVGPPLSPDDVSDQQLLKALIGAAGPGLALKSFKLDPNTDSLSGVERVRLKQGGFDSFYRLVKPSSGLRYCFEVPSSPLNGLSVLDPPPAVYLIASKQDPLWIKIDKSQVCGVSVGKMMPQTPHSIYNLKIKYRSVRSAFAYLGAMAKNERENAALFDVPRRNEKGDVEYVRLFGIVPSTGPTQEITYGGQAFRLTRGEVLEGEPKISGTNPAIVTVVDASELTVQLLSELIAIYSSAKDFPTPNVIAIQPH